MPRFVLSILLLYFWANGIAGLDRYPRIHQDESWIAAPGYEFWSSYHFGTPLFAGFYGMETHYYGFMPLFSLLVGAGLHLFGVGLFQARVFSLIFTLLTLALTYRLGADLFSHWHGVLAVMILVLWKITLTTTYQVSGIPLTDLARVARYDSLVPVFGLLSLILAIRYQVPWQAIFIGVCVGLALLSHVYGVFWLPVVAIIILSKRQFRAAAIILISFSLTLFPYALFVASGWDDFLHQNANYAERFSIFDLRFYQQNLLSELQRYQTILDAVQYGIGAGLCLAGLCLGIWTARRHARLLLISIVILCLLFALLLRFKTFSYLATLLPLFVLIVAAGIGLIWQIRFARPFLGVLLLFAGSEGIVSSYQMRESAAQTTPHSTFTAEIATHLTPDRTVMAMQHYWFGLAHHVSDYRSFLVPIFLTNPAFVENPVSFADAIASDVPDVILIDEVILYFFAEARPPDHPYHELAQEIQTYLQRYHLIATLVDPTYGRLLIYGFNP